jgi:hypothetical protein
MGQLGNLMPLKSIFKLGDPISTTRNPWQECAVLNCENQQIFAPQIWFNLEPASGATDHQGNPVAPKCMFMLGDHIHHCEPLGRVHSFKWRKSAKFWFKNLVQFGTGFRHCGLCGKSEASEMHVHVR